MPTTIKSLREVIDNCLRFDSVSAGSLNDYFGVSVCSPYVELELRTKRLLFYVYREMLINDPENFENTLSKAFFLNNLDNLVNTFISEKTSYACVEYNKLKDTYKIGNTFIHSSSSIEEEE